MRAVLSLFVALLLTAVCCRANQQPLSNVQVTWRGKNYNCDNVSTVQDLQAAVQKQGVATDQNSILFHGKRLAPTDNLRQVGVEEGAQLNMVPGTGKSSTKKKTPTTTTTTASSSTSSSSPSSTDATQKSVEDLLKQAGLDSSQLNELLPDGKMPSMKESMSMMNDMMNSPMFQDYMNDPENLEKSRQMILNNPMLKNMMGGMPGMEELLNDPVAWREAMMAAANMYKNMDPETLMKAMGGDENALGNSAAAQALDELDEED